MDEDRLRLQPRNLRSLILRGCLPLRRRPDIATVRLHVRRAVHRLHRGVRQKGAWYTASIFVAALPECRRGVAFFSGNGSTGLIRALGKKRPDSVGRNSRVGTFVPFDFERFAALQRRPSVVRHNRHAGGNLDHVLDAANGLGLRRVKASHLPAEDGATHHRGVQHARPAHVDAQIAALPFTLSACRDASSACRRFENPSDS